MKRDFDYNLLIKAEKVRYQSDFSSSHWLHQVICKYAEGMPVKLRRDAFETVLRIAINVGCKAAIEKSLEYPEAAGFPQYIDLSHSEINGRWSEVKEEICNNFEWHLKNRFGYLRQGD